MDRLVTPETEAQIAENCEYPTPVKAQIKAVIDFCEAKKLSVFKRDVFRHFYVLKSRAYHMLQPTESVRRTRPRIPADAQGRPKLISDDKLEEMEQILETEGIAGRALTWEQLGFEVGLEVSGRTIQQALGTMDYHKCIACDKGWVSPKVAKKRLEWAQEMYAKYLTLEHWKHVRFSDEVHFGYGPQQKLRIIQKPGQRHCIDCLQERDLPKQKDKKRFHCWAAVGYNFKSPIIFYEVPGNTNGKMSQRVYIDQILDPVVKPWLEAGQKFVVEDGNSGHGPGRSNIVQQWKIDHGLVGYFNCASSPDLSPIEKCWAPPKAHLRTVPHWSDWVTRDLILEGWEGVTRGYISQWILSMPYRLLDIINSEGKIIGW